MHHSIITPIDDEAVAAIFVDIEDVGPNPLNPRGPVKPEDVADLVESIKVHGVIEPLIVDCDCRIIAGERRYVAAKLAGLKKIPVSFRDPQSDCETRELALIENVQREDLKPITEAKAYADLMGRGLSVGEISKRTGIREDKIRRMLRLLKLPEEVQNAVENQTLSIQAGLALLQVEDQSQQKVIAEKAVRENLTTKAIKQETGANPKPSPAKRLHERRAVIINHALDRIESAYHLLSPLSSFSQESGNLKEIERRLRVILNDLDGVQDAIIDKQIEEERKVRKPSQPQTESTFTKSPMVSTLAGFKDECEASDREEYLFEAGWSKRGGFWRDPKDNSKKYNLSDALAIQSERGLQVENV